MAKVNENYSKFDDDDDHCRFYASHHHLYIPKESLHNDLSGQNML
jgi:hypothetical protein